jgi:hypothetical protein
MDVNDLEDEVQSVDYQSMNHSFQLGSRNKPVTPLGKEIGPRLSSKGPSSRPSMRTQQSLKQLPGDHGLLSESDYD